MVSERTNKGSERWWGREKTSGLSSLSRWAALESSIIASTDKSAECWTQYCFWRSRSFTPFPFPFPAHKPNLKLWPNFKFIEMEDKRKKKGKGWSHLEPLPTEQSRTEQKRKKQREESVVMAKCLQLRDETLRNSLIFGCYLSLFAALPYFPFLSLLSPLPPYINTSHFLLHQKYHNFIFV